MTVRITQQLLVSRSLTSLQTQMGRMAQAQERVSTGRLINRPSDSPSGTNQAMQLRERLAANDQYARNGQDALRWMGTVDTTLTDMLDRTRKARDLVLQGASTGSTTPESRQALATELKQIRDGLLDSANPTYLGRPVFGGTTGQAYAPDGTFLGNETDVTRRIGDGVQVDISTSGTEAFGDDGTGLFAVLDEAITALESDPAGDLQTSIKQIDGALERMRTAAADVGARYARVESAMNALDGATLDTKTALADVENIDVAEAILDLQMQEVAYQASLGATARVLQPSLMDFLR
jgi:flagellar hook-associated protein 3 FlgL